MSDDVKREQARAYRKTVEESLEALEDLGALTVEHLEKFRETQHKLIGKLSVIDDVQTQLDVVSVLARNVADMAKAVGKLSDTFERIEREREQRDTEVSRRLRALEAG